MVVRVRERRSGLKVVKLVSGRLSLGHGERYVGSLTRQRVLVPLSMSR